MILKLTQVQKKQSCFKLFNWNLNGLVAHDFTSLSLIEAYIATNYFDIVFLPESVLDSSTSNDGNINIAVFPSYGKAIPVTWRKEMSVFIIKDSYL